MRGLLERVSLALVAVSARLCGCPECVGRRVALRVRWQAKRLGLDV